jgi:hypothetical protein
MLPYVVALCILWTLLVSKVSALSSRCRALKLSTYPFPQGELGAIYRPS